MLMYVFHYVFSLWPGGGWNPMEQSGLSVSPAPSVLCDSAIHSLALENTTILSASYLSAGSHIYQDGTECQDLPLLPLPFDVCRVSLEVDSTADSSVKLETWLPANDNDWNGRFLTVGNGHLGGCIDRANIHYGVSLGFATVGSNNGHDNNTGEPFLDSPDVIIDFAHRATHIAAVVGKVIVQLYYSVAQGSFKSYYLGCSAGGRQGIQAALMYPADFNGIVAGAPGVNWNHLMSWGGMVTKYLGPMSSPSWIPPELWTVVNERIVRQCGDPVVGNGSTIITEPDNCEFDPRTLPLCSGDPGESGCFNHYQINALRKIYSPLRWMRTGEEIYPRFDPGAELDFLADPLLRNYGTFYSLAEHWYKYAVFNDSALTMDDFWDFSRLDIKIVDSINPGGIATWNGDLSRFKNLGGKLLTYHGRADGAIPSGISKRLYELVASKTPKIDEFYKLFLVPGLHHCMNMNFPPVINNSIPGSAWNIGQGPLPQFQNKNDIDHNILLALVDWVESTGPLAPGPTAITGVGDNGEERKHCPYPQRSILSPQGQWDCI